MDSEFSRQRLVENISTLMQQQKLKVGEVEQRIGISTGYLSKMLKKDTVSAPSADTIWKLAKVFGVSTDMLIEGDFSGSNENIQYLRSFFSKLKSKTISDEIEWEAITIDDEAERNYVFHLLKARNSDLNNQGTGSTFKAIGKAVLEDV